MIYLLTYSRNMGSEDEVKSIIDKCPFIRNWRTDLPNIFFIESDVNADELADYFIEKKQECRFFITEIANNRQGWLPKSAWEFLKQQ